MGLNKLKARHILKEDEWIEQKAKEEDGADVAAGRSYCGVIKTFYIGPPIPIRRYDWKAWFDGHEENGHIGYGSTEQDAIADLKSCEFCGDPKGRCEHGNCLTCDECESCHHEGGEHP